MAAIGIIIGDSIINDDCAALRKSTRAKEPPKCHGIEKYNIKTDSIWRFADPLSKKPISHRRRT